jgi:2-haloacid dehalogenase
MAIKGLIFDAYGTLYDVHSVQAKTEQLCPGKGDLITQVWRLKQLEMPPSASMARGVEQLRRRWRQAFRL